MSFTRAQLKENLIGLLHGSTLNKVRNQEAAFERAANNLLGKVDILETMRTAPLQNLIHSDIYNVSLPSDFNKLIDLSPQTNRTTADKATNYLSERFDLEKALKDKTITIMANAAAKFMKVNWKIRPPKTLDNLDSLTANGAWAVVGSATGLQVNNIFFYSGNGSIEFDLVASGDGIQNSTMTPVDMTDEQDVADIYVPVYLGSTADIAKVTNFGFVWGENLTTKYWTGVAQTTQADGTAFQIGWNILKFPWSTATKTGTPSITQIKAAKFTVTATVAINNIRVDNIVFAIGQVFNITYYSKYLWMNSAGTWISRTSSDDDILVLDNDAANLYLYETAKAMAQQVQGEDANADIQFCDAELNDNYYRGHVAGAGAYTRYRKNHPSQAKKVRQNYFNIR